MPRYAEDTAVSSDRSRAEIERILRRYGATAFAYGWEDQTAHVAFKIDGRQVRFRVPLPDRADFRRSPTGRTRTQTAADEAYEKAVRQRWRALALVIKAKLEAVEAGITTVEDEFLSSIALPDGRTVGEWVRPQLAVAYGKGDMPALLPGGSGA